MDYGIRTCVVDTLEGLHESFFGGADGEEGVLREEVVVYRISPRGTAE